MSLLEFQHARLLDEEVKALEAGRRVMVFYVAEFLTHLRTEGVHLVSGKDHKELSMDEQNELVAEYADYYPETSKNHADP